MRSLVPNRWRLALLQVLACVTLGLLGPGAMLSTAAAAEKVQITDPYIELRTGPGRGYPVFHVAPRADWIELLMRHTDWFKVRTADGREGWVNRQQLETVWLSNSGGTVYLIYPVGWNIPK